MMFNEEAFKYTHCYFKSQKDNSSWKDKQAIFLPLRY